MLAFDLAVVQRDRLPMGTAFDKASARSFDTDGRMHVKDCRITKANVSPYYGREIPQFQKLGLKPNVVYMMWRAPEELQKAADSFSNLQLMMPQGHTAPVGAHDAKPALTVGTVGTGITFDGTYLVANRLSVWTKEGIRLVETEEASELSSSYRYRPDMTPGVTPGGVAYDGVMRDITGNHVALVRTGRAGRDVVVNDAALLELPQMKLTRPNLLARIIALGVLPAGTYGEEEKVALDAQLAAMTANDCTSAAMDEDMEDDPENPGKKRKKGAGIPGKVRDGKDAPALDAAALDAALTARGFITKADADKLASDSADAAVARVNALHVAREAVKPLVGIVALDSADAVYRFALGKEGVALDGVTGEPALAALVAQRVAAKSGTAPAQKIVPVVALDSNVVASAIPGLGRIQHG